MVIRAGENVCAIFMHKKAPCRLFGTGAMAQTEVLGILRREAELPLRAGNRDSSLFKAGRKYPCILMTVVLWIER